MIAETKSKMKTTIERCEKILDGRLGTSADVVEEACRQYIASEDALPDEFDNECYQLSTSVESLVAQRNELQRELESLQKACAEMQDIFRAVIKANNDPSTWAYAAWTQLIRLSYKAISADCGKDYVHVSQVEEMQKTLGIQKSQLQSAQQRIKELEALLDPAKQYDAHRKLREALENEKAEK